MPAKHVHQHLVRRIAGVEPPAELGHLQIDAVGRELRRDQRELVAEPTPGALADDHGGPTSVRVIQCSQQPFGLAASLPRHRTPLTDVEVLGNDASAERRDELRRVAELPAVALRFEDLDPGQCPVLLREEGDATRLP
ncbi:hypothetical protein ACWEV3_32550 [Saccharopolyspora sp. NPDC003752]